MGNEIKEKVEVEVRRILCSEVEAHRKFIEGYSERLFRDAKWLFGAVAIFVAAGFTFLFGKSYYEFENKLLGNVKTQVDKYLVTEKIDESIAESLESKVVNLVEGIQTQKRIRESIQSILNASLGTELNKSVDQKIQEIKEISIKEQFIPKGTILPWYSQDKIPIGWAICDGSQGTPDLRNRFLMGAAVLSDVGKVSGSDSHRHGIHIDKSTGSPSATAHAPDKPNQEQFGNVNHTHRLVYDGMTEASNNIPPNVAVLFIMKL